MQNSPDSAVIYQANTKLPRPYNATLNNIIDVFVIKPTIPKLQIYLVFFNHANGLEQLEQLNNTGTNTNLKSIQLNNKGTYTTLTSS